MSRELEPGGVLLLENSRFEPGETANDPELAAALAALAEVYVNDAFGAAHRAHATTEAVAHRLPAYAGLLLERELEQLGRVVADPERPLVVVLGGAKVSDKIGVIDRFLETADAILIGGAMCFSFFRAQGVSTGDSLVEEEGVELAAKALEKAEGSDCDLRLPVDLVLGDALRGGGGAPRSPRAPRCPKAGWASTSARAPRGSTQPRSPPRGRFSGTGRWARSSWSRSPTAPGSWPRRSPGTEATTVVGGGDSVAALEQFGLADRVDWLCTGGGASLELLEGKRLPGVEALRPRGLGAGRRRGVSERRPYVAANWKMSKTVAEAEAVPRGLPAGGARRRGARGRDLPLLPRAGAVAERCSGTAVRVAAQNMHEEEAGAFTGEVSAPMLLEAGADGGHPRAFGAPAAVRRDRRGAGPQGARGARGRAGADPLRRRDRGGSGRRADRGRARAPDPGRPRGGRGGRDVAPGGRLRADLGDRDRPHGDARAGPGGDRLHPRHAAGPRRRRRAGADPLRRLRQAGERGRADVAGRHRRGAGRRGSRSTRATSRRSSRRPDERPVAAAGALRGAGGPRRLGDRRRRSRERDLPGRDAELRPALGSVPAHSALRPGARRRACRTGRWATPRWAISTSGPERSSGRTWPGSTTRSPTAASSRTRRCGPPASGPAPAPASDCICSASSPTAACTPAGSTSRQCIELATAEGVPEVVFHAFTDGRDTLPHAGRGYLAELERWLRQAGRIGTVAGRFYAMDRDTRWERIKLAYDAIAHGEGLARRERRRGDRRGLRARGDRRVREADRGRRLRRHGRGRCRVLRQLPPRSRPRR